MNHLGRKLFHVLGGLGLLSLYFIFGRSSSFILYGALVAVVLLIEVARLSIPAVNHFFYAHFGSFIRKNEEHSMTGTVPYIIGISLSLYAYATPVAVAAVCFLAFGDVAATTVGERFGRTKIGKKSLEGTAAFIVIAVAAGLALHFAGLHLTPWVIVVGAIVAAGVELLPLPVNDNLMIPVLSGAVMELILRFSR
jgi:glycerol-3-phosphate acyltransferase PlsY